jgi:hypothetical protein
MRPVNHRITRILAVALFVLCLSVLASAEKPTINKLDGPFARYNDTIFSQEEYNGVPYDVRYGINVSINKMAGSDEYLLNFNFNKAFAMPGSNNYGLQAVAGGFGIIPAAAVEVNNGQSDNNPKRLILKIDTAAPPEAGGPMYLSMNIRTGFPPPPPDPNPPGFNLEFGTIELQWDYINSIWTNQEGHSIIEFPDHLEDSQGWRHENGAVVHGSFMGQTIEPAMFGAPKGYIGDQKTTLIIRNNLP